MSEAALRVGGNFSSLDDLLHHALNLWILQLSAELRWQIALDLYTSEHISSGRAAEIADLNYVVFMEKLNEEGIPFIAATSKTEPQKEKRKGLIREITNLPQS